MEVPDVEVGTSLVSQCHAGSWYSPYSLFSSAFLSIFMMGCEQTFSISIFSSI